MTRRHLIAAGASAGVAVYVMLGAELGNAEFAVLLAILVAALVVVAAPIEAREKFADSSMAIYNDLMAPRLDRLIHAMGGRKVVNPEYVEDEDKDLKQVRGSDIAKATGTQGRPKTALRVANEFRLISAFLCNCAQSVDKASVLKHVGVGKPVYT